MNVYNLFSYISYQIFFVYLFFYIYSLYFPYYDYVFYSIISLIITINGLGFFLAFIHRYNFNKFLKNIYIVNLRNFLIHIVPLIHVFYNFNFFKSNIIRTHNSLFITFIIILLYIAIYFLVFKNYKLYLKIWNIKLNKFLIYLLLNVIFCIIVITFIYNSV